MASYRSIDPVLTMNAGVMTGVAVIESAALDILHLTSAGFEAVWTGAPNGTFQVMVSLTGQNYSDLGLTIDPAIGSADFRVLNIAQLAVRYIKLRYTNTSGVGSLNVYASAKGN
jgi:hypothetical protein